MFGKGVVMVHTKEFCSSGTPPPFEVALRIRRRVARAMSCVEHLGSARAARGVVGLGVKHVEGEVDVELVPKRRVYVP